MTPVLYKVVSLDSVNFNVFELIYNYNLNLKENILLP